MPVKPGVLDANILAYAVDADAPQNAADAVRIISTCSRCRACASFRRRRKPSGI